MKKILVAIDGSDHAKKAIELASDLAVTHDAALSLVHVVREEEPPEGAIEFIREERIEGPPEQVYMEMAGRDIIENSKKVAETKGVKNIHSTVLAGDPVEKITEFAEKSDVDAIFLGNRGLGGLRGLMLGSVSSRVCHQTDRTCVKVR